MTEQMNVPKLRFLDFSNTWRMEKLGKLVEINSGDSPSKFKMVEEGIPFFKVEQLNNSTKYQTDSIYFINEPKKVISKGSVIFPKRGASILLNKIRILKQPSFMDTNLMTLTANAQLNNEYLYYFILREDLSTLADTTSIPQINNKHILPYPIALPTLPEQQKIASFLSKVDEKIALLTEKKDKLAEYKKGVMQQLFNGKWEEQDGQLTFIPPTLRFKADDGSEFPDWEEKKLGEIFSISAGGDISKDHSSQVKTDKFRYPVFANAEANKGLHSYSDIYKVSQPCITVSGRGSLGNAVYRDEPFYPIVRLLVLKAQITVELKFYEYAINLLNIYNESTGVPQLTAPQLRTYGVVLPCINEQTKIADFLSAIDQKIDLANSELEKAKEWKKGLLQQMFV